MKNLVLILVLAGAVGVLTWFVMNDSPEKEQGVANKALTEFHIPASDTARIDRLVIDDNLFDGKIDVVRTPEGWQMADGSCAQQHLINGMLQAITKIRYKGRVGDELAESVMENALVRNRRVDIYLEGKLAKSYFIANNTQDGLGTFMVLETPEEGRSPEPVVVHEPGARGTIDGYFVSDVRDMKCSGIFNYNPANIKQVSITYPEQPENSFSVTAQGENEFAFQTQQGNVTMFDTSRVREFLVYFRKIHFEFHNRTLKPAQIDSVKSTTPYATVEVEDKAGKTKKLTMWKRPPRKDHRDLEGNLLDYDPERMFAWYEPEGMVVVQFYVMDRILLKPEWFGVQR